MSPQNAFPLNENWKLCAVDESRSCCGSSVLQRCLNSPEQVVGKAEVGDLQICSTLPQHRFKTSAHTLVRRR